MNHRHYSIWIFVFLLLTIFLTGLYPRPDMIFFGAMAGSLLILLQVLLILTSVKQRRETADEEWYERS